jgi:hypothetical protein
MTTLQELREAVETLRHIKQEFYCHPSYEDDVKAIDTMLSLAQSMLDAPDRVEVEKFIPSYGDPIKHMPTDEQAEICKGAYLHYAKQVSKPDEYDFNRGFEFGYGACLLKNNAAADISNAIIAKKELEIAELKKRQIFTGSAEAFLGFTFSEQQLIGRIKELEQELARVREGER